MSDLLKRLDKIAYLKSKPFCYSCYVPVKGSHCPGCGSDDLMREDCNGVEWGTSHIIDTIIQDSDLEPIDLATSYDELLDEIYEPVTMGYCTWYPSDLLKTMSPVDYSLGKNEYLDSLIDDNQVIEINASHYWERDLNRLIESLEDELGIDEGGTTAEV